LTPGPFGLLPYRNPSEKRNYTSASPHGKAAAAADLQRDDGHFTFAEEYSYSSEYEGEIIAEGWQRLAPDGIFESAELAEVAGRSALFKREKE
jgi:hypothetical protein